MFFPYVSYKNDFYTVTVFYDEDDITVEVRPIPHSGNLNLKVLGQEVKLTDPDLSDISLKQVPKINERLDVAYKSAIELEKLIRNMPKSL